MINQQNEVFIQRIVHYALRVEKHIMCSEFLKSKEIFVVQRTAFILSIIPSFFVNSSSNHEENQEGGSLRGC